ncbi:unnamed protein product, partial [Prorocentrum cordatum]
MHLRFQADAPPCAICRGPVADLSAICRRFQADAPPFAICCWGACRRSVGGAPSTPGRRSPAWAQVPPLVVPTQASAAAPAQGAALPDGAAAGAGAGAGARVFSAEGSCPASVPELQGAVLRFVCGSASFGPLPVSGVGLNAALRREYMRAGHARAALAIFRAENTVAALRGLQEQLAAAGCRGALKVEEAADGEDILIVDADPHGISQALLAPQPGESSRRRHSDGSGRSKRARREDGSGAGGPPQGAGWAPEVRAAGQAVGQRPPVAQLGGRAESVDDLLNARTARQRQLMSQGEDLRKLLAEPTARQSLVAQKFMNKSTSMAQFCPNGSRCDCRQATGSAAACEKIHFKKIIKPWTDESLGDCSYLDTCRHIDKCKYVHYALDLSVEQAKQLNESGVHNRGTDTKRINELAMKGMDLPAQWVYCDLRRFPLSIFNGLVSVVMADPPWDIHMELPYGTLTDEEVKNLKVGDICEDGLIFLWVTGRAMELARECFRIWGYRRIEEIIWVKTNQLQRIIRTGRTGHWLNHSKEHCLVGIKGNPKINRNLDCDVIVSEVRETSRKPDEIYNLIERMMPNCLKVELFGRPHNVHENWITCGNQLDGVRLANEEIVRRYNREFPRNKIEPWRREREAVVPLHIPPGGGRTGATTAEGAPWVPPASAPPRALEAGADRLDA